MLSGIGHACTVSDAVCGLRPASSTSRLIRSARVPIHLQFLPFPQCLTLIVNFVIALKLLDPEETNGGLEQLYLAGERASTWLAGLSQRLGKYDRALTGALVAVRSRD